jgi:membrane-bound lytic murein transglycosylase D
MRIADNGQISLSRDIVLHRTVIKAGKNETVASIAKRYRLNAANVANWNKVSTSASFRPEQHVVVYLPAQPRAVRKSNPRPQGKAAQRGKGKPMQQLAKR